MKKTLVVFITGIILAIPVMTFARWGNSCWSDGYMPGWGGRFGNNFFNGGMFMFLGTILIAGIAAYFGYNYLQTKKNIGSNSGDPFEILKTRYAKGDISKEDFDRMKADLA